MNIVSIDPKKIQRDQRKEEILEVLEHIRTLVENDEIDEFVACTQGPEVGIQIHASCLDAVGGVGLLEIGKTLLIDSQFRDDD